ncbi:MAG: hypothetical protein LC122_07600 [Chitinophagales bacterium]|nr:hypothetical protein [Chitinophagales bacterium]
MKDDIKKKKEKVVFDYFRKVYSSFPKGEIIYQDKPDFLIKANDKIIGVEITEAINDTEELTKYKIQVDVANRVLEKLKNILKFTFSIDISLNNYCLSNKRREEISHKLMEICSKEYYNLKNLEGFIIRNYKQPINKISIKERNILEKMGYRYLPEEVDYIYITRYDIDAESWNSQGVAFWAPAFDVGKLSSILEKKEKKLIDYTKCDEQWLILFCTGLAYSYYKRFNLNETIDSDFDKIFFIQLNEKLLELKTKKRIK